MQEYNIEKKGKGKQYNLPCNIWAIWKNIRGEGKGTEVMRKKIKIKKKGVGKDIKL